jgi:hypothetical protein
MVATLPEEKNRCGAKAKPPGIACDSGFMSRLDSVVQFS